MAFFKRKTVARSRGKIELLSNESGTVQLAFGLQWTPIVSTGGKPVAVKLAKDNGATHLILIGQQVGYGAIAPAPDEGSIVFPAAQVAAHQFGGDALHVYKIQDGEYWLACIRNNQPTSIDQFIRASNDSVVLEQAERIVSSALEDHVAYQIFTNLELHSFQVATRCGPEELLLAASQGGESLEAIPKTSFSIPKPVLIATSVAVALIGAQSGYKYYKKQQAIKAALANMPAEDEPSSVAWGRVMKQWAKTKAEPKSDGFREVRQSIGELPAKWKGWSLLSAGCVAGEVQHTDAAALAANGSQRASPLGPNTRQWSCEATYERSKHGAVNTEIVNGIPSNWVVIFHPLNSMSVKWTVAQNVELIDVSKLQPPKFHFIETVSKLQSIAPIFPQDIGLTFTPLSVPAPKKSDGKPYPPSTAVSAIQAAPLVVKGPLRSIDMLMESNLPVDWNKLSLSIGIDPATKQSGGSINQSPIVAEVSGVVYAKDN